VVAVEHFLPGQLMELVVLEVEEILPKQRPTVLLIPEEVEVEVHLRARPQLQPVALVAQVLSYSLSKHRQMLQLHLLPQAGQ
jgi:hypothetical protein